MFPYSLLYMTERIVHAATVMNGYGRYNKMYVY
nr:MAG TPA: protein of unknown function DUF3818 [Caudoviricetes sp.]